jgi:hypothetical protein
MAPQTNLRRFSILLLFICIALLAWLAIIIASTMRTINSTGTLSITASEPSAVITVSQLNHNAVPIGTGDAKVRLKPGDYLLASNGAGLSATQTVHVTLKKNVSAYLNLAKGGKKLPSVESVGFINMDVLVNDGLTTSQANDVKTQFFTYKTSSQVVNIDADSVQPGAHNPDSYDPFTLNFTGTIDSTPFRATVAYTGYDNAQLTIYDQTGTRAYIGPGLPAY